VVEVEPIRGRERSAAEREPTGEILSAKHEGADQPGVVIVLIFTKLFHGELAGWLKAAVC
jgi:hypothetical protein